MEGAEPEPNQRSSARGTTPPPALSQPPTGDTSRSRIHPPRRSTKDDPEQARPKVERSSESQRRKVASDGAYGDPRQTNGEARRSETLINPAGDRGSDRTLRCDKELREGATHTGIRALRQVRSERWQRRLTNPKSVPAKQRLRTTRTLAH